MNQQPLAVTLDLTVKTYDIDFAGIVSNIVYIRWLEDLRLKLFEFYLPLQSLMEQGYCPIIHSTAIEYKKALRVFDRPVGKMWMSQLGRLKCTLQAEIYLHDELVTSATQTGLFINLATMRPMAVPAELKALYQQQ